MAPHPHPVPAAEEGEMGHSVPFPRLVEEWCSNVSFSDCSLRRYVPFPPLVEGETIRGVSTVRLIIAPLHGA